MPIVKRNRKGEIVTMLVIVTVVVLGAVTLISSIFLKEKQTIKTKAAEECSKEWYCGGECAEKTKTT